MRRAVVALVLAAGAGGCGEEETVVEAPRVKSSRVALTVAWPGLTPWALITYQNAAGQPCHAIGTLTADGPQVLGHRDTPLDQQLGASGRCLKSASVSLAVAESASGDVRVIGGIAASGVRRVVVGGERVRPSRSGAFLVAQPAGGALGREVELVYAGGGSERVALDRLVGADARD